MKIRSHELGTEFVGENLKTLRKYYGFKKLEMVDFLNIASVAYSYYETGRSMPLFGKLIKIAVFYDVTDEQLKLPRGILDD